MMNEVSMILEVRQLSFAYGSRKALNEVSFSVRAGEVLAILGPNGSGKSTLFKLLSTLVPVQDGEIICKGINFNSGVAKVRSLLGVVFQSPGLDKKLTVKENLRCQAALYGMPTSKANDQIDFWLKRLRVEDRSNDFVESLSGGLARRVEMAKALLHRPEILILDEPSTGLDPRSRSELWECLFQLCEEEGVTILVTTHLMDEAQKSSRVLILDEGRIVACDSPIELMKKFPHEILTLKTPRPDDIANYLSGQFSLKSKVSHSGLRVEISNGSGGDIVAAVSREFGGTIETMTLSQSGLEDAFFALTGKNFGEEK
ncbi:MAG: ABC transporter ATP-binding protein [Verrucomicrobiota bacterium]|nr:ABC transporter ATP-binding protein [Verrucomicrobiota bacterium]